MSDLDPRDAFADAVETDDDPLARYEPTFARVDANPFVAERTDHRAVTSRAGDTGSRRTGPSGRI